MLKRLLPIIGLSLLICLAACEKQVKGSGISATDTRTLLPIKNIEVSGDFQVNVVSGATNQALVTSDNNITPYIITQSKGDKLFIRTQKGVAISPTATPKVDISLQNIKDLNTIKIVGMNTLTVSDIATNEFNTNVVGNGDVTLAGKVNQINISVAGSGHVNAQKLIALNATVHLSGSGNVGVYSVKSLKVRVSGSGKINYFGEPRAVDQKIDGTGEVLGVANNAQKN